MSSSAEKIFSSLWYNAFNKSQNLIFHCYSIILQVLSKPLRMKIFHLFVAYIFMKKRVRNDQYSNFDHYIFCDKMILLWQLQVLELRFENHVIQQKRFSGMNKMWPMRLPDWPIIGQAREL